MDIQKLKNRVSDFKFGGIVTTPYSDDIIPALAIPGETVMRKADMSKYTPCFFTDLNKKLKGVSIHKFPNISPISELLPRRS